MSGNRTMRGTRTFQTLFEDHPLPAPAEKPGRGRSKQFHARRNECLADRYFFYGQQKRRYSDILADLSNEFFISVVTVSEIMDEIYPYLSQLKKQPPTPKQFAAKWPHFVWS